MSEFDRIAALRADDPAAALAAIDELIERVDDADDHAYALIIRGLILSDLGRPDEELATYAEIVTRWGDDPALAWRVARAEFNTALTYEGQQRYEEALAAFERVEAYPELVIRAGLRRAGLLERAERRDEAAAARNAAFARVEAPAPERMHGELMSAFQRHAFAGGDAGAAARAAFGPGEPPDGPGDLPPSDERLAEALATAGDWALFADPPLDRDRAELAGRALALYRESSAVLDTEEDEGPRTEAAVLLRTLAGSYALLSAPGELDAAPRARLPTAERFAQAVAFTGLDHWAEDRARPLMPPEQEHELPHVELPEDVDPPFTQALLATLSLHEVLTHLRGTEAGRAALRTDVSRSMATQHITWAWEWMLVVQSDPARGTAAMAMMFFAEAWFAAAWSDRPEWFPDREMLEELLEDVEVDWPA